MGEGRGEDVQSGRHGAFAVAVATVHEQHRHRARRGVMGGSGSPLPGGCVDAGLRDDTAPRRLCPARVNGTAG
ncbi:hypothetical protein AB0L49_19300 [Streptomyces antimycoticus]|uniref:hypothetical protein n=1 Tax=Streptomyces antimycoticus TaxID=68175 RepID=UPI00342DE9C5